MADVAPLRRQVLASRDRAGAYRLFTDEIGRWWPLEAFGVFGAGASVALAGDRIVETSRSGEETLWGTVVDAEPPARLAFTWHPGRYASTAMRVTVTFTPTGDAATTLVTLEHSGWEAGTAPQGARAAYARGWFTVLDRYVRAAEPAESENASRPELWFVLQHAAGPAAPAEGVASSPDFAHHVRFLSWLRAEGVLVAAGSLPDDPGSGMTVVRVAGTAQARRVVAAAQLDDGAVTRDLLDVRVRPWQVALPG